MKRKLGELLIEQRLINAAQLQDALALQRRNGMRLGAALVARGHLTETQLVQALGRILSVPVTDLRSVEPDPAAVSKVRAVFASEHDLFPYALRRERGRGVLTVAMSDPLNYRVIDELGFITDTRIETVLARPSDIDMAIRKHYGARFDRPFQGHAPAVRLASDLVDPEMTIVRRGGGEEKINTETGRIRTPYVNQAPPTAPATSPPTRPPPLPRADSAMLLTDEVPSEVPTSPPGPIPLRSVKHPAGAPPPRPAFDESLGALIDAAGDAVNAESFQRLERKFWALMRLLAKKGILTNEDFVRELGEE